MQQDLRATARWGSGGRHPPWGVNRCTANQLPGQCPEALEDSGRFFPSLHFGTGSGQGRSCAHQLTAHRGEPVSLPFAAPRLPGSRLPARLYRPDPAADRQDSAKLTFAKRTTGAGGQRVRQQARRETEMAEFIICGTRGKSTAGLEGPHGVSR